MRHICLRSCIEFPLASPPSLTSACMDRLRLALFGVDNSSADLLDFDKLAMAKLFEHCEQHFEGDKVANLLKEVLAHDRGDFFV